MIMMEKAPQQITDWIRQYSSTGLPPNFLINGFVNPVYLSSWSKTGNSGINSTTNFIGTTDNQDLVFKRNNVEFFRNRLAVNRSNAKELFIPLGVNISFARSDAYLLGIGASDNSSLSLWGVHAMNFSVFNGDFTWYNSNNLTNPRIILKQGSGNFLIGTTTDGGKLYIKAQGALSTDNVFRIRNSADNADILNVTGDGRIKIPSLQTGNSGLTTGQLYKDTAANILASGDWVIGMKV